MADDRSGSAGTTGEEEWSKHASSRHVSTFQHGVTRPVTLGLVNGSGSAVQAFWVDYDGAEHMYATVQAGDRHHQSTFNTHTWNIRAQDGTLLVNYMGDNASISFSSHSPPEVQPCKKPEVVWSHEQWGQYRQRGDAVGIPVMAFDCVSETAIQQAEHIIKQMLLLSPSHITSRMQENRADVAIIGSGQVTTDIPAHQYLKGSKTSDGRCFDEACRGLGGTSSIPTTSCAEENCTMVDDRRYASESILVHEFGHAVMNLGVNSDTRNEIEQAYRKAKQELLYDVDCYMMANADEYWAEAVQSWFCATLRSDVNSGINSRELLEGHDPRLASILRATFGETNYWRFIDDCPGVLKPYKSFKQEAQDAKGTRAQHLSPAVTIGGARRVGTMGPFQWGFFTAVSIFGGASCCSLMARQPASPNISGKKL